MITLPLTKKELEIILDILKGHKPSLYAKLWSYKINYLNEEKINGLS